MQRELLPGDIVYPVTVDDDGARMHAPRLVTRVDGDAIYTGVRQTDGEHHVDSWRRSQIYRTRGEALVATERAVPRLAADHIDRVSKRTLLSMGVIA